MITTSSKITSNNSINYLNKYTILIPNIERKLKKIEDPPSKPSIISNTPNTKIKSNQPPISTTNPPNTPWSLATIAKTPPTRTPDTT
jgi:hypothetical protein